MYHYFIVNKASSKPLNLSILGHGVARGAVLWHAALLEEETLLLAAALGDISRVEVAVFLGVALDGARKLVELGWDSN